MLTKSAEMLEQEPISTLLGMLYFTKPDTESYRDIVKELFRRDVTKLGGVVLDAADEYRDRLFREAYDFRSRLDDEWGRLLKLDPIVGEDCRDPCPICHPDQYKAEFDPLALAAEKAGKEVL
jgi:hypothetical protein